MTGNCCSDSQTCCFICGLYGFAASLALVLFLFWLLLFPKELRFAVTGASITRFDLSRADDRTVLSYTLALNITIVNPNGKIGVYFDHVEVAAGYRKRRFAASALGSAMPFFQGRKNTTLRAILEGKEALKLRRRDVVQYRSETSSRVYSIDVSLGVQVRTKYGKIKSGRFKPPKIECNGLKVPLLDSSNNGTSVAANFKPRVCMNVFILFSPEIDDDML